MIRSFFVILVIIVLGCNSTSADFDHESTEQIAFQFFLDSLLNEDSVFYIIDEDGEYRNMETRPFLEDSLFVDGFLFYKKLIVLNEVIEITKPEFLESEGSMKKYLEEEQWEEYLFYKEDYLQKKKAEQDTIELIIPRLISSTNKDLINYPMPNTLLLKVFKCIQSKSHSLVEIRFFNLGKRDEITGTPETYILYIELNSSSEIVRWRLLA